MCCQETKIFVTMKAKESDKMKNYLYIVYHLAMSNIFLF